MCRLAAVDDPCIGDDIREAVPRIIGLATADHMVNFSGGALLTAFTRIDSRSLSMFAFAGVSVPGAGRQRDAQRARVYRWEDGLLDNDEFLSAVLTHSECVHFVRKCFAVLGLHAPNVVTDPRLKRRCYFCKDTIYLAKSMRMRRYLLHEAAHDLAERWFTPNIASHGPEYVSCLMGLLAAFGKRDDDELRRSATEQRVSFLPHAS